MSELAADKTHKTNKTSESKKLLKSKCLNERRRRDQENLYFEELAELISASITDMNSFSVKPEKCAILQESLNQIKQIKQEAGSEAVQQSQVSSSKPSVLASNVLGPLLLEALDGFMFVVNSQGKVEFVTENVTAYLKYAEDDLVGKSIYNIIHVGDHAQFSNSLLPMSLGSVVPWPSDAAAKGRTFNCRMLVKPPCEESEDVEVKQTYVSQYENMQISAILQPGEKIAETSDNTSTDGQSCLVCIARRISLSENTNTMLGIEQFTTKQDLNGKIIGHDTSGIAHNHYMCPNFNGQNLQDFCHTNDVQTLSKHIQEVLKSGNNTSSVYRFKLQDNRYVFVQTKSQLFPNRNSGEAEYVLSTHCIIRECDSDIELKGSASTSLMKSIIGQSPINNTPQRINQQPGGAIPNSISMMLGTINNYITSTNSGILAPPEENLDNIPDPFNSTNNWDNSFASVDAANSLGSNGNFPMSIVSSTTSNVNSWNNMGQIKPPTAQMPPSSQQRPMLSLQQQQMSNLLEKQRQQQQSSMNFQRQNSFESGGQKSPRFTPSPSSKVSPFQMPNQRMSTMMGYPNQRSPGSSNSMGQNRMSPAGVGYQVQRTSPLSSSHQTGNLTQSQQVYLRLQQQHAAAGLQRGQEFSTGASTMTSQPPNPLQALQCMDSRQSNLISASNHISPSPHLGGEFNFPLSTDGQMDKRSTHRAGKLSQLLTQNSSNSDFDIFSRSSSVDSNASVSVSKAGGDNFVLKSPADSGNQSPSPGPGQSPQDKPQSTTHIEDSDSKTVKEPKANNVILKQLLSQEDDVEGHDGNSAAESKEDSSIEMDKNEAEAKKTNNVLLKQLLSEDHSDHADLPEGDKCKVKQRKLSGELLHILLNEQDQNCTSAPAESTSQDTDLSSRQRHQSGPQEPQSTTMTPMTPVTPLTPLTPLTPQSLPLPPSTPTGSSQTGQPLRSQTPQQGISFSQAQSTTSSSSKGAQLGPEQHAKKLPTDTSALIKDKNLDSILNYFWEKGNEENISSKAVKRKAPPSDIDSASDAESEMLSNNNMHALSQPHSQQSHLLQKSPQYQPPQDSQQPQPQGHSRLIQKNALLAKLLSKKNAKETKIFTQLTVSQSNPCENPQQRFQKNLSERLLTVKPNTKKVEKDTSQDRKDIKLENSISGGKMDAMKDQGLSGLSQIQGINGGLNTSNSIQSGGIDSPGIQGSAANQQQFQEQYEQLQRLLSGTSSSGGQQQTITNMEVDQSTGDSSDTLLDQILQQAADLQQDINKGNIQQIGSGSATPNNNLSDDVIISQLEQVLGESEFSELESVLMNSTKSGMTDMMAIEAIQKQLMSEEPAHSVGVNGSTGQSTTAMSQSFSTQQTPGTLLQGQGFIQNTMAQQQQNQQVPKISTAMDLNFQLRQMGPPGQPQTPTLSPQQPFSQAAATNFGPQGPRLPGPQVPHGSALSGGQQRPMFSNPSSTAIQVRQSLLQQQKLKQMREVEKQRQERQRLLLQRQLNQQFNQRFPQNMENQVQSFPENLGDLMNSGSAPNVTIQRNQIPGPMSPRFAGGGLQQLLGSNNPQMSQQPNLNQLLGPSTANPGQMSPHFNQPQTPTQWARQQGSMGIPQSGGGQFNMNRHRSLSGGSIPNSGQQSRFQFPDSQFNGNQSSGSNMGMYNQQQSQQMFNQNRMMQRQISMPQGRGSPRTPQSPFGNSPDPLLMSPHSMSPNNTLRQQQQSSQVSPPFNQSSMSSAPGSFTQSVSSMPGMNSQTQSIGSQGFQGFDLQQQLSELESKKIENLGLGMAPGSTSQYVKQELRNICSARSEKQLQQHQQQAMQQQQVSQNAPVLPPQQQQQQQTETYESEIPLDIFEQINEMAKEHGVNPGHPSASLDLEDFKEEDILKQKRQEAKHIYEQFQALAKIEKPEPAEENPEVKATKLFRTQLLTPQQQQQQQQQQSMMRPGKPEAMQVQVVQKEPRSNVEEMKPHDHKNSLLQQLLSE